MRAESILFFPNSHPHLCQDIVSSIPNPFPSVPPPILTFWIGKWRQSRKPLARCDRWRNETGSEKIFFTISKYFSGFHVYCGARNADLQNGWKSSLAIVGDTGISSVMSINQ